MARWEKKYPKLCLWVEENNEQSLSFYRLPRQYHKSTNMLERLNEGIRRRTRVVRIFPNEASCQRLMRALCGRRTRSGWRPIAI
ncbi:MAG: transposase [Chloroflexota bacterium]